jgi:hypothetical protein
MSPGFVNPWFRKVNGFSGWFPLLQNNTMKTCREGSYTIFNLLPDENYIYHFRIELTEF